MATGDLKNNLKKLQREASLIHYPQELDYEGLMEGAAEAHLPILYYAFQDYSLNVHEYLSQTECNLAGKRGTAFLTLVFRLVREKCSSIVLKLKVPQFMSNGFAERKIMLTTELLHFVRCHLKKIASGRNCSKRKLVRRQKTESLIHSKRKVDLPDVSTIKHDGGESQLVSSLPVYGKGASVRQMQSTTLYAESCVAARSTTKPLSSTVKSFEHDQYDGNEDAGDRTAASSTSKLSDDTACGIGIAPTKIRFPDVGAASLTNNMNLILERLDSLEKTNKVLMGRVNSLESVNRTLLEEISSFRNIQQDDSSIKCMLEKVNTVESKVSELSQQVNEYSKNGSPVCGNNLCGHFRALNLSSHGSDAAIDHTPDKLDTSLADITNESPIITNHRPRLLELIKGTRDLLGMDADTPKSSIAEEENKRPLQTVVDSS